MCKRKPREQEILIAGMLNKNHILDLLKNYVIYEIVNNRKIKKIAKHQQYRVVSKAIEKLESDKKKVLTKVELYGIHKVLVNLYQCYGLQHNSCTSLEIPQF